MQTYTLFVDCDCGGDMETVVGDVSAAPGDPVRINVDMAVSQATFVCSSCGDRCHTGDLDDICFGEGEN